MQPHVKGASRGKGDRGDAERAGGQGERAGASNEYGANAEPGEEGYVEQGGGPDATADLDPHEPPGQG